MAPPTYLIYDAHCSLCKYFKELVLTRVPAEHLTPIPLEDPRVASLLPSLTEEQIKGSFHLVWEDGRVKSGPEAMPDILRLFPLGRLPAWCLEHVPGLSLLNQKIYRYIALHRPHLP